MPRSGVGGRLAGRSAAAQDAGVPKPSNQTVPTVPAESARRLLMGAQGLLDDPTRPATAARVRAAIERMGFVQLDSINIVQRAHHHILGTRFDAYTPETLTRLHERDRALFEHWTHDASLIPAAWFPQWRPRFARACRSPWWDRRLGDDRERLADQVLSRIARDGPLMSKDFEHEGGSASGGWWEWKPQKAALEYLWRTGRLAIAARVNFHKVYDLTERVLPELAALPSPSTEEHIDWACRTAIERLGVATPGELAAFWDAISVAEAAAWTQRAIAAGEIAPVLVAAVDGPARRAVAVPDWEVRFKRLPPVPERVRLLSPFDPVIRDRRRAVRLFGFDYRFEAFVPEAKRRFGYYTLPVLEGERFIGRLDAQMDRRRGVLCVSKFWWEPGVERTAARLAALEEGVARCARQIGVDRWTLPRNARSAR